MKNLIFIFSFLFFVSCSKDAEPVKHTLTVSISPADSGTVNPNGGTVDKGEQISITASPASEYLFDRWTGGVTGTNKTISVTMDSDKSVTANFIKKKYSLTINVNTFKGSVTEKVIKIGAATEYNSGTIVELTAEPKAGWKFKEWSGDLSGNQNPIQITLDKPKTVEVAFEEALPFYLDANGVTIKARDWVTVGTSGLLNGVTYTAVDNASLKSMADNNEDVTKVVTTLVTDLEGLFAGKLTFNQDIGSWDVSNVTNVKSIFSEANSFNQDIGSWDVGNVTNMRSMFSSASTFNQDIGSWNVAKVTDMTQMFFGATTFNKDIGSWDVGNVTSMRLMFSGRTDVFLPNVFNQDISNWNVSKVTNMSYMFFSATAFNQDISGWTVGNVINMSSMFFSATAFNQDIGSWDVSKVAAFSSMFSGASTFNQDIGSWNVSKVINMNYLFRGATAFNQDIGSWDVSNVTTMVGMFNNASSFGANFSQNLTKWCVSNINSEPSSFADGSGLSNSNKPKWGTCPVWRGNKITFTKSGGTDPTVEANQDRMTSNVWITRGNNGGQIYNIKKESVANKTNSPVGTKWAVGTLAQIESLNFKKFREAVGKPKDVVGKNLVMYLEDDDVYLSVKFSSWSEGKNGGFSYERTNKPSN